MAEGYDNTVEGRKGNWMQLYSGAPFWPADPRPEEINIIDISHSLGLQCRYAGHVKRFYSVAEHCVLMSRWVEPEYALTALLHDATEAYVVDVPRPVKYMLSGYLELEQGVADAIAERYQTPAIMPARVKEADNRILLDERRELLSEPPMDWNLGVEPLGIEIYGWDWKQAAWEYENRFWQLTDNQDPWLDPATHPRFNKTEY